MTGRARLALASAFLAGAGLAAAGVLAMARRRGRGEDVLYTEPDTLFGEACVLATEFDGEPVRVLSVEGTYQSATYVGARYTEPVFAYIGAFDLMFAPGVPMRNVLMVGGGGYAYPKHVIAEHPETRMDVVELDPAVTRIAWRYFYLDRLFAEYDLRRTGRLGLVTADGRAYLDAYAARLAREEGEGAGARACARYDAVVIDSFGAGSHVPSLMSADAARSVRACLVPGGMLLANVVAPLAGPGAGFLHDYTRALAQVFRNVWVVPVADAGERDPLVPDNLTVVASDAAYGFAGATDWGSAPQ